MASERHLANVLLLRHAESEVNAEHRAQRRAAKAAPPGAATARKRAPSGEKGTSKHRRRGPKVS